MSKLRLSAVLAALLIAGCASPRPATLSTDVRPGTLVAQPFERTVEATYEGDYLLYLPDDYDDSDEAWPLVLFLHGAGERGTDLDKVKVHGPPKLAEQGQELPFILVAPQAAEGLRWAPNYLPYLGALLDEVEARYRVDPDRVYVTGLSMGGEGTWELAMMYPERFAAIAPICGRSRPHHACIIADVPTWVFHGDADTVSPLTQSSDMVAALEACGAEPRFTVYEGVGHDAWTRTYDDPAFYDWLLSHHRSN